MAIIILARGCYKKIMEESYCVLTMIESQSKIVREWKGFRIIIVELEKTVSETDEYVCPSLNYSERIVVYIQIHRQEFLWIGV